MRRKLWSALCASLLVVPMGAAAQDWEVSVTPYAWLIDYQIDTSVEQPSGGTVEFSELMDILDFAGQIHIEAHNGRFGVLLDATSLQVSDRRTRGPFEVDTDSGVNLFEAAAILTLTDSPSRFDLLVGARSVNVDIELEIETLGVLGADFTAEADETLTDVMVGLRYQQPLSDQWTLKLRGDVATGDTDFSWNVSAIAAYQFTSFAGQLELGYRYLDMDVGRIGDMEPEITVYGPGIGLTFNF